MPPSDHQSYAVYWSIYTDFRGRQQFRKLYWDRLKDLIGRPAKLIGIEREALWPSGAPSHELRCHVWRFFMADNFEHAVAETMRAASRVAPDWRVVNAPRTAPPPDRTDELFVLNWCRDAVGQSSTDLPLSKLTDIQVSLNVDTGFRVRPGFTIAGGGDKERPALAMLPRRENARRTYAAEWRMQLQTSTKRELLETHWPQLQAWFGEGAEMIELEKRSGDTGPFQFKVRKVWLDVTEDWFVTTVLTRCGGLHVILEAGRSGEVTKLRGALRGGGVPRTSMVLGLVAGPFEPDAKSLRAAK